MPHFEVRPWAFYRWHMYRYTVRYSGDRDVPSPGIKAPVRARRPK